MLTFRLLDYWEFKAEGIEFAFPTTPVYLAQDNKRPLQINLSGGVNLNDSDKD